MNANSNTPFFIYVDVDDTFVRSAGTKRIPMPSVIEHIRELKAQGATLYCWSSGGADYARQSAEEFGLADCFVAFLPKPNVLLDDQSFNEWRYLKSVHPTECSGQTLEDYRRR
jgi:predicted HAD superfamily phosphohydrolase YqeG